MSELAIFAALITISIAIIGALAYSVVKQPKRVIHLGPRIETQWWGYGWRPFWRKYDGLPGLTPKSALPMPLKPIIIPKS